MSWKFWKKKKCCADIDPLPVVDFSGATTRTVKAELYTPPPYKEPTDKELLDGLWEGEQFEAAARITELKKQVANLKRKLTILQKKYDGINQS